MLEILGLEGWQIVSINSVYPSLYFVIHPLDQRGIWHAEDYLLSTFPTHSLGHQVLSLIDRSVTVVSND